MTELEPSQLPLSLGATIRQAREQKDISIRVLATEVGVHRGYLSHLEADFFKRPRLDLLQKIATVLDLDFATLVSRSGHQMPTGLPSLAEYLAQKYKLDQPTADKLARQFKQTLSGYLKPTTEKETGAKD